MKDYGKYPGGKGHEWRGEWDRRLLDILGSRGFERLTDFAQSRPTATLEELAAEIGVGDVTPIQLQWKLVEEAKAAGTQEQCARDLLVRECGGSKRVGHPIIAWTHNKTWWTC